MAADRTESYAAQEQMRRDEIATVTAHIDRQEGKYVDILPSNVSWGDFRNAFLVAVQMNPRLLEADRQSLWLSLQRCASDGLKPDGREAALVIFGDDEEDEEGNPVPSKAKGKKKVVYMPMVFGLVKLVRNTGNVANIRAKLIYRGERVVITDEDGKESYKHVREIDAGSEIDDSPGMIIGAYAVINYKDGFWEMEAMTARQIARVRAVSRAKKGPWQSWPDEMSKKTVLRRLIKRLDKSPELRQIHQAIEQDESMGTTIDGVATETSAPAAIEQDNSIKQEFNSKKQAEKVATAQQKPKEEPKSQQKPADTGKPPPNPDEERRAMEREQAASAGQAVDTGEVRRSPENIPTDGKFDQKAAVYGQSETAATAIELWPVDENGEPLEGAEPMDAAQFTAWFVQRLFVSKNAETLIENNADNIGEIRSADSKAFGEISDAMGRYHNRAEEMRAADKPKDPPAAPARPVRVAIPVPKTPRGADHWPNYGPLAFEEILTLVDEEDIQNWIALNKPTYKNKATEIAIDNRIRKRREALGIPQPGESPPAKTDAAGVMTDDQFYNAVVAQMREMRTDADITAWSKGQVVTATMRALKMNNPEMFSKLVAIIDQRIVEVTVEPAGAA